jgi:hypothetical protein
LADSRALSLTLGGTLGRDLGAHLRLAVVANRINGPIETAQ